MNAASSRVTRPTVCRATCVSIRWKARALKHFSSIAMTSGGRGTAISGSRPTMMVSLWWRVWLHRQGTDSRNTMNDATSYSAALSQSLLKAVPWPASCHLASEADAYRTP